MIHSTTSVDRFNESTIQALASWSADRGSEAAFQALLAASANAVRAVRDTVAQAQSAALSLAQAQSTSAIADDLDATAQALESGLSEQAACLRAPRPGPVAALRARLPGFVLRRGRPHVEAAAARPAWLASVVRAMRALDDTARHLDALADGQPDPSPSRQLGHGVAAHLRRHRDGLMEDVARLVD